MSYVKFFILTYFLFSFISCFAQMQDGCPEQILHFWFGKLHSSEDYPEKHSRIWFGGGPQIDQEIQIRFEPLLLKAINHELDSWKETPRGRLALILLLDQFPRNMYRGTSKSFAFDSMALELTLEGLALNEDLQLFPIEQVFFHLPLEHSEDLPLQKLSVEKFHQIEKNAPSSLKDIFKIYENYAEKHFEIIEKFGRFPHRNSILGRESTRKELAFLQEPNSSF